MLDPAEIDQISINGRFAFGVSCLEIVCKVWNVKSQPLDYLVEQLWKFTSSNQLGIWIDETLKMLPDYWGGDPSDFSDKYAEAFGFINLDERRQKVLTTLIEEVVNIGNENLFAGFVSEYTRTPTLKVGAILDGEGIQLPSLDRFKRSHVSESHGWGERVPPSFFQDFCV
jgi:hypothetical protein